MDDIDYIPSWVSNQDLLEVSKILFWKHSSHFQHFNVLRDPESVDGFVRPVSSVAWKSDLDQ